MKTINLTDEQFDNLFYYLDEKVNQIVDTSVEYQDSELLEDFEDLFEVYDIIGEIKNEYEKKLEIAQAKQPKSLLSKLQGSKSKLTNMETNYILW